ncbi:hypothetical protein [uncultured Phenylobacterium sp.]|uniref:hypothetical protein n=1 Tax=uncultured Phenylobacterium sp. TaxID=349273 RepID=UPI0025EF1BE2|nr:hypothetical protein [uncultured Phenylobacterium sp.]
MQRFRSVASGVAVATATATALACAAAAQPPPVIPFPQPGQSVAPPGCAPTGLFRAVTRNVTPGLAAADRAAQPRTLYRQGSQRLRNEEQPDLASGAQALVIIAEPDLWVLNETTRQGQHSIDPGPDLSVRAPIVLGPDVPAPLTTLEYGCEIEFVARHAPTAVRTAPWGAMMVSVHAFTIGDHHLVILVDDRRAAPVVLSYLRQGRAALVVRYDEYSHGLPNRPELFAPPSDYRITEAPAAPPSSD